MSYTEEENECTTATFTTRLSYHLAKKALNDAMERLSRVTYRADRISLEWKLTW